MKGNQQIIEKLNFLLADELTAINQYVVHAEMCSNWGYETLHKIIEKRSIEEMKHAEKIIARILFLEGQPVVSMLNEIKIGAQVESQLKNDRIAEDRAIRSYNEGIQLALELGDNGTCQLMESNLLDEESHIDWIDSQLDQIMQMGIQNYLAQQKG